MEEQEGEDGEFTAKIDFGDVSQTTQNSLSLILIEHGSK